VGVSIIDHRPQELMFLNLRKIKLINTLTESKDEVNLTIADFQVRRYLVI
jgi:hypothetical protein